MYTPMTREVRTLIRGLALCFGTQDIGKGLTADWDADSLDLAMLETELALVQELHPHAGLSSGPRKVHVAGDGFWRATKRVHVFHFGAYADAHVLAFGTIDDALEDAAAVLLEVAPGMFTEPDYDDAIKELSEELGRHPEDSEVHERAETDLTYTESGYIASCEWTVTSFESIAAVLAWASSV